MKSIYIVRREVMKAFKTIFRAIALLAAIGLLTACGALYTASPGFGMGGYSSRNLDSQTVEVRYLTGATAGTETPKEYVLYRCAEISLERGYEAFRILESGAYSVGSNYGYTSSAVATMRMSNRTAEEIAQNLERTKSWPEKYNRGAIYLAKEVKASLEAHIKRN